MLSLCPVGRFRSAGLFYCRLKSCLFQKYFWKFSKKRVESGVSGVILAEREKSTRHPHGKGVRRWKLSLATMANSTDSMRSAKRCCEMRPGTITEIRNVCLTVKSHSAFCRWKKLGQLTSVDHYPCEEFVFSSYGCDLHIDNELVANAFAALPKQEQSILILFCVLELGDGEIGDLMGMSRSAVQRHRAKTLNELRKKLKAHLPEGG